MSTELDRIRAVAYAEARARLDARNCKKGVACGNSCIPQGRQCRKKSSTPAEKARTEEIAKLAGGGQAAPEAATAPKQGGRGGAGMSAAQQQELEALGRGVRRPGGAAAAGRAVEGKIRSALGDLAASDRDLYRNVPQHIQGALHHLNNLAAMEGIDLEQPPPGQGLLGNNTQAARPTNGAPATGNSTQNARPVGRTAREAGQLAEAALRAGAQQLAGADRRVFQAGQAAVEAGHKLLNTYEEEAALARGELKAGGTTKALANRGGALARPPRQEQQEQRSRYRAAWMDELDGLGDRLKAAEEEAFKQAQAKYAGKRQSAADFKARMQGVESRWAEKHAAAEEALKESWTAFQDYDEKQRAAEEATRQHIAEIDRHIGPSVKTHAKVLGLDPGRRPSKAQLRKAYRKAALATHPDRGGSPEAFRRVNEAFEAVKRHYKLDSIRARARRDAAAMLARRDAVPSSPEVVAQLRTLFATVADLRITTHLAHLDVLGPTAYQLHLLFERIYKALDDEIDTLGEHIRAMGVPVPASTAALVEQSELPPAQDLTTPDAALAYLAMGSGVLRDGFNALAIAADATGDQLTVDLAGTLGRQHARDLYLIDAVRGQQVDQDQAGGRIFGQIG
jgi:DNA-binding ferritin-like protein